MSTHPVLPAWGRTSAKSTEAHPETAVLTPQGITPSQSLTAAVVLGQEYQVGSRDTGDIKVVPLASKGWTSKMQAERCRCREWSWTPQGKGWDAAG